MFFAKVSDLPRSHGNRSELWGWCDREREDGCLYTGQCCLDETSSSSQMEHLFPLEDRKRDKHGTHPPYPGMSLRFCCLLGTDQGLWLGWGLEHLFSGELATWGCGNYTWSREHVSLPGHWTSLKDQGGLLPRLTDILLCQNVFSPWILLITLPSFPGHFSKEGRTVSPIHRLLGNVGTGHSLTKTNDGAISSFDLVWMDLVTCLSWMEYIRSDSLWLPGASFTKGHTAFGGSTGKLTFTWIGPTWNTITRLGEAHSIWRSHLWVPWWKVPDESTFWVVSAQIPNCEWRHPWMILHPGHSSLPSCCPGAERHPLACVLLCTRGTGNTGSTQRAECTDLLVNREGFFPMIQWCTWLRALQSRIRGFSQSRKPKWWGLFLLRAPSAGNLHEASGLQVDSDYTNPISHTKGLRPPGEWCFCHCHLPPPSKK